MNAGDYLFPQRSAGQRQVHNAGSSNQVSESPLKCGDWRRFSPEDLADGGHLGGIGSAIAVAVSDDHSYFCGSKTRVVKGDSNGASQAIAIATDINDAHGFGGATRTEKPTQHSGLPGLGAGLSLEDQGSRAFTENGALPVLIERANRILRQ
jgi:hypothetical protein